MRFFALIIPIFLFACEGTPLRTDAGHIFKDSITGAPQYYPIASFVAEEIKFLEEFPTGIMRHTSTDNFSDSSYITLDSLKIFAAAFEEVDLNKKEIRKKVKETSFFDQTIDLITLNYTIEDTLIPVRRVDIMIKKGESADKVHSIYIEKKITWNNIPVSQKLYWKSHKNCMIVEQWTDASNNENVQKTSMVWNTEASD